MSEDWDEHDVIDGYADRYALGSLWRRSNARIGDCEGCGTPIRVVLGATRKWCEACLPLAEAMYPVRHAVKVLAQLGETEAVIALQGVLARRWPASRRERT